MGRFIGAYKQSGGSPGNIITNAARKYGHLPFDQRFFVLDSDIPISQQDHDKAKKHGYHIILWSPICLGAHYWMYWVKKSVAMNLLPH
ncbi:hypothetical protein [Marinobacter sp. LQ44]|uniref:hypothetical protein n=1 Tax=unclassified Marinobacter TaxID=83889 RepID=UPI000718D5E8|nr:hypothetical protein [Marinobacter sp. LQ44]AMQ89118.1 hypothetical protein ASQ50_10660 [Marinobacter sp. LQ44]